LLTIEEYMARRKKEDQINEFSLKDRTANMKICVDYVFEYFNQYLDITKMDEQTILNDERLDKYRKSISLYEIEVQDWLVQIYDDHNKQIDRSIGRSLKKDDLFFLYNTDNEFRSSSYEIYALVIKKNPFLKDQTEMLYRFIKDFYQIQSQPRGTEFQIKISAEVDLWIEETWKKYNVNLYAFCSHWVEHFFDHDEYWPRSHKIKSNEQWIKYNYDFKQKNNLFNLNTLYPRISGKPFIKGKKQYLENLMMYFWLHSIVNDDDNYWDEYMDKYSKTANKKANS
jgi:hypothetical protein